eukprot:TRINITY_DN10946_c0_g1_i1.p3 TRINITY_DN10946_c0_g1~~TRINITY_DN10946_c0_g1_i1.p3  ORF type:complete len:113 (+),score=10.93 TRINITY_DN10946_c0_g1_i1:953-1291(+)
MALFSGTWVLLEREVHEGRVDGHYEGIGGLIVVLLDVEDVVAVNVQATHFLFLGCIHPSVLVNPVGKGIVNPGLNWLTTLSQDGGLFCCVGSEGDDYKDDSDNFKCHESHAV